MWLVCRDVCTGPPTPVGLDALTGLLPLDQLLRRRRTLYDGIISSVERELQSVANKRNSRSRRGNLLYVCDPACTFIEVATTTLLSRLETEWLWPSRRIRLRPLTQVIETMKVFEYWWDSRAVSCHSTRCVKEAYVGLSPTSFRAEAAEAARNIRGPCLECYRKDGQLGLDGCEHVK